MGGAVYGGNVKRVEESHGETETMDNEIHEPHDRMGRACWTARNGMIYGERCQRYSMERKRLKAEARVYLNAPKDEALVPIENSRATRGRT